MNLAKFYQDPENVIAVTIINSFTGNNYIVDSQTVISRTFPITQPYVDTSANVYINSLWLVPTEYSVQNSSVVINGDVPLVIGDAVYIRYLQQG